MKEIIEIKNWYFKIRSSNKRKYYDVIIRRNGTYFCSCPAYKFINSNCKHIELVEAIYNELFGQTESFTSP